MTSAPTPIEELCINTIRTLSIDAVQDAKSGHPGAPMGAAPMAFTLWHDYLKHNPSDPAWADRDRFVLSAGHASMLLYSLLHLYGYGLPLEEIRRFRQWGSQTPGHPEFGHTAGVEVTTGPLGAGFSNAVGFAMAERFLATHFNRPGHEIVDHHTYAICSDGDLMEGIGSEAASLAGTLGLGKLICLYDDNEISIEGDTALAFREDVPKRFEAYGWHVQVVTDGNDTAAIGRAIAAAKQETARPSLIAVQTVIAYGSPNKAGSHDAHGAPLGEEEIRLTKRNLGWPEEPKYYIPGEVQAEFAAAAERGRQAQAAWEDRFAVYAEEYPDEAARFRRMVSGQLPEGWASAIPSFAPGDGPMATRAASGKVLNALAGVLPGLIGGSADLAPSNNTHLAGKGSFGLDGWGGQNIHFGVREHGMGGIVNGMARHGGLIPFGATFLVFSDYMRASLRLAAIMRAPSIFVFTHDSIGVGEDGPTHQPVEHLASFRAMPGISMMRPADANETAAAWQHAVARTDGPTLLVLTRQNLPVLDDGICVREGAARGAYVLAGTDGADPDVILIGTGSEVSVALDARDLLAGEGVAARVVSMPSWDLFEAQPREYRDSVLPPAVRARVAIEAGASLGWERYIGDAGEVVAIDHFGASAPAGTLFKEFGFTPENVAAHAKQVLARLREGAG